MTTTQTEWWKCSFIPKAFLSKVCYSSSVFSRAKKEQVTNSSEFSPWLREKKTIYLQAPKEGCLESILHAVWHSAVITGNYYESIIFIPAFWVQLYTQQKMNLGEAGTLQPFLEKALWLIIFSIALKDAFKTSEWASWIPQSAGMFKASLEIYSST